MWLYKKKEHSAQKTYKFDDELLKLVMTMLVVLFLTNQYKYCSVFNHVMRYFWWLSSSSLLWKHFFLLCRFYFHASTTLVCVHSLSNQPRSHVYSTSFFFVSEHIASQRLLASRYVAKWQVCTTCLCDDHQKNLIFFRRVQSKSGEEHTYGHHYIEYETAT